MATHKCRQCGAPVSEEIKTDAHTGITALHQKYLPPAAGITLTPSGSPCKLVDCPPGPFRFGDQAYLKLPDGDSKTRTRVAFLSTGDEEEMPDTWIVQPLAIRGQKEGDKI